MSTATHQRTSDEVRSEANNEYDFVSTVLSVLSLDPTSLDDEGLDVAIGVFGQLRGIVTGAEATFVAEIERRRGQFAAEEALRKRQRMSSKKAKRRAKTAGTTAANPKLKDALSSGEVGEEHADALADIEEQHEGATDELLGKAKEERPDKFRNSARDWSRNRDGDHSAEEKLRNARSARTWTRPEDGMGMFLAQLDPESYAVFIPGLATWVRRLRNEGDDPTSDIGADEALIFRTSEQLLLDALVAMTTASLSGDGGLAAPLARMLLIANFDAITGALSGKLVDGTPMSPAAVRRIACDAEVLPAIFNGDSQPIDLGLAERLASPAQRALLASRDGGCRGCGAHPAFCFAHHIIHWVDHGPTDLDNLVLLCSRCHHLVHEGGYDVVRGQDGFELRGPDQKPCPPRQSRRPADRARSGSSRREAEPANDSANVRQPPPAPSPRVRPFDRGRGDRGSPPDSDSPAGGKGDRRRPSGSGTLLDPSVATSHIHDARRHIEDARQSRPVDPFDDVA